MTYPGTTTGRVSLAYYLEIEAVGCMTTIAGWEPSTDFPSDRHYSYLHWPEGVKIRESQNEKTLLDVGSISLTLDGQVLSLFKDTNQRGIAMVMEDVDADETLITTDTTADFAASGYGWINDTEVFEYESISVSRVFTLASAAKRGMMGTKAQAFEYDLASVPRKQPLILDGPVSMEDKRAILYVSEVVDGVPQTGSAIYRGRISKVIPGSATWEITLEHISRSFQRNVCWNLPRAGITPNQYCLETGADDASSGDSWPDIFRVCGTDEIYYLRVSSTGTYAPDELRFDIQEQVQGGLTWGGNLDFVDGRLVYECRTTASGEWLSVTVRKGSPLWCLGFATGTYIGTEDVKFIMTADDAPRPFVANGAGPWTVNMDDASDLEDGPAWIPGEANPLLTITSTTATTAVIEAYPDSTATIYVEKEEGLSVQNVFSTSPFGDGVNRSTYDVVLKRLVGTTEVDAVDPSCALTGFRSADFDWDEFANAFASVPADLCRYVTVVTKKVKFTELISPYLGMLGISLRITSDGKIGAYRNTTPIASGATALDSGTTLLVDDVRGSGSPLDLLTSVKVVYGYDWKTGKYLGEIEIKSDDALAQSAGTRAVVYEVRGLAGVHEELVRILRIQLDQTHLSRLGRYSQMVDVRTTYRGRAHRAGDDIVLTHDMVPDLALGVMGVTSRPCEIKSRISSLDGTDDMLTIRMVPPTGAAGWAPCALATTYTAGTKTLNFADVELYSTNDLSAFVVGDAVRITDYDSATPTVASSDITAVTSSTVVLADDITSIPAAGAWLTPATYADGTAAMQTYAYVANQAARPDLDGDDPTKWGR